MKYGFEEKLSVISEITCGKGLKTVCRERHLDRHEVRNWLARFRLKSGSVIVPAIMHGTFNAMIPNFTLLVMPPNDLLIGGMGLAGTIVYLLIFILIFLYDRYISKENLFMKPMEPQVRVPEIPSGN